MQSEIEEMERKRFSAMLNSDAAALEAMLDGELIYTHSFGERDGKESYLEKVRQNYFDYVELDRVVTKEILTEDCAIVFGHMTGRVLVQGKERRLNNSTLAVWRRTGRDWRLIAFQPTVVPLG